MKTIFSDLETKFRCLEKKRVAKISKINKRFDKNVALLNSKFDQQKLLQKYSLSFNSHRQRLLNQTRNQLSFEIDRINKNIGSIQSKDCAYTLRFILRANQIKSCKICVKILLNNEFKFFKVFDFSLLIKYRFYLGLNEDISNFGETEYFLEKRIQKGDLEALKYLIEHHEESDAKPKNESLMSASFNGHLTLVKYLVENGADLNATNYRDDTVLIQASFGGHLDVIKYLAEIGADLNARGYKNDTVLIDAAYSGFLKVVEYLVENGADLNAIGSWDQTALMNAAISDRVEIVKYLAEKGADLNAKNNKGETAFSIASAFGHLDIVEYLAGKGVHINM
jgi:hypothetical protein